MKPEICLYLLRVAPIVKYQGVETHISDSSLDLLIYMAVEDQPIHDRDVLTRRLYESTQRRDNLRQSALGNLNKEIKDLCIRPSPPNTVGYDNTHMWVDVHEFSRLVRNVNGNDLLSGDDQAYTQLLAAYDLYQHHFLEAYSPTLYGLTSWIEEQRRNLRELFHSLLERLIQYEIANEMYAEASLHAESWHQSLPDDELPLQYLIWLTARMEAHGQTRGYLRDLEVRASNEARIIGYSAQEWRRRLERKIRPEIEDLRLGDSTRVEISKLLSIASKNLIGRTRVLEHVFETLFVTREHRLLTVTGPHGIGKTVLAEAVGNACMQVDLVDRVIQVGMFATTDFDSVLNAIALQVEMPQLMELDYRNKYVSIEQVLEAENSLLILDQQEDDANYTDEFIDRVRALSQQVITIVCSLAPWEAVYDVLLPALDHEVVTNYLYENTGETVADLDQVRVIIGGSPLALELFISAIHSHDLSLADTLAQINQLSPNMEAGDARHERVLSWCWQLLDEPAQHILVSLMDFDPLEGPDRTLLRELHSDLPEAMFDEALKHLESMSLIELHAGQEARPSYRWHSLLNEFLWAIDAPALASDDPSFKLSCRERFCGLFMDYLYKNIEDYLQLDLQQRNLLHAFDLGFEQGHISLTQVNAFLPYLLARGMLDSARWIVDRAMPLAGDNAASIKLRLNAGRLNIKRGEFQTAERQLNEALALAETRGDTAYQGDIYDQLSIIAKNSGRYERANELLDMALEHARSNQNARLLCRFLANKGATAVERGNYKAAKDFFEESLKFAKTARNLQVTVFIYTSLGVISNEQLEFELSLNYLAQAQVIVRQIGSPERQAYIYINTGVAYYYLQRYVDAQTDLENGLSIAKNLQHEELVAHFTQTLGRIEAAKGNMLEAEHRYKLALMAALDRGLTHLATDVLLDIGKVAFQTHKSDYARRCFRDAFYQALDIENHGFVTEALFGLGITAAAATWIIGPDDIETTMQVIKDGCDEDLLSHLTKLQVTRGQLDKAEFLFRHGLVNFPDIQRYRIAEALARLLGLD